MSKAVIKKEIKREVERESKREVRHQCSAVLGSRFFIADKDQSIWLQQKCNSKRRLEKV
jgi:hypothetical protein